MQVRQFDCVGDQFDLGVEARRVLVGDIGHLFEQEIVDLGSRESLEHEVGAYVQQQIVAGSAMAGPAGAQPGSTTLSSAARPVTTARNPSSMTSFNVTTSPELSGPRASTTL